MHLKIKDGALFISDAHDNQTQKGFHNFLIELEKNDDLPPQLFLMGDMFELLVGESTYTKSLFKETITLINRLSEKIEIFYFEGNHDFNLKSIFPKVKVYPLSSQPMLFQIKDKKALLSHGDLHGTLSYSIYTYIARNRTLLKILNIIDIFTKNLISKKLISRRDKKDICYKIENFQQIIKQKIQKYDIEITEIDFICEGHHHQNREFVFENLKYKNFSSFACDKSYYKLSLKDKINFIEFS